MSLRWIHENLVPPNCDEESSDIDDSCSDDSYDSDLGPVPGDGPGPGVYNNNNNNNNNNNSAHFSHLDRIEDASLRIEDVAVDGSRAASGENGATNGNGTSASSSPDHPSHTDDDPSAATAAKSLLLLQRAAITAAVNGDGTRHEDAASLPRRPSTTTKLKLFCRTGYYIGVGPSGRARVYPPESKNDAHVRLILCPASYGVVRLQSAKTGHYLAFNATGHLYGEAKMSKDNTEWEEWNVGDYSAFRSHKYAEAGWWLGVKRNGRHKPGPRTAWGQKAIQFLPIRLG